MITVVIGTPGSAAYVDIELFEGAVEGKLGSFGRNHSGVTTTGDVQLTVMIMGDSGSGVGAGISEMLEIDSRGGLAHLSSRLPAHMSVRQLVMPFGISPAQVLLQSEPQKACRLVRHIRPMLVGSP